MIRARVVCTHCGFPTIAYRAVWIVGAVPQGHAAFTCRDCGRRDFVPVSGMRRHQAEKVVERTRR